MTPFQKHVEDWKDCRRCLLAERRSLVVLLRGSLPCDILFTGEAPGASEDALGKPFIGPAGKLLDRIVKAALGGQFIKTAYTNLVGCIPREEDGNKAGQPPKAAILACAPRLIEVVGMAKPKLIVCVGKLATEWVRNSLDNLPLFPASPVPMIDIVHPAAILRAPIANQGLQFQKAVILIQEGIESYVSFQT